MVNRRLAALLASTAIVFAACSSGAAPTESPAATEAATAAPTEAPPAVAECIVGVSWNNYQEERWAKWDEPALKAAIEAGGGKYISNDAASSTEKQASNVENLITQGAKVVILLAQDGTAIKPAVTAAISGGVPVIAYDRLIEDPQALYITFDNKLVGKLEAQAIFDLVPKGNWAIIKGSPTDANSDFLRAGGEEVIGAAVASGDIKIVGETYTDNWDPENAKTNMEQILTANDNKVDAVWSENDGMAGGAIAALTAQGLAGKVPVSGQDGDQGALNRVALGTQTVSIWKDSRGLGKAAGDAAIALCGNADPKAVAGTVQFTTPGGNTISSIFLQPNPITRDTLNLVLDAGWTDKATLCKDVPAGAVAVCG